MSKLNKIILLMATPFIFVACSNEAPKCSDSATTDLVIEIANAEIVKGLGQEAADTIELSVETIRTTDTNEKVGSFECAADLKMSSEHGSNSIPITYTSELANDGDDFYVNVYGL